ncbi:MAG: polysaccharide deacetylase family protein [Gammaproteobacteria bacterium]|nr:polysaccharide deacetylase family protein [Gammaproteobacteria bacterium]
MSGIHKKIHKGKVVILMYHRVLKDKDDTINYTQPGMYVTTSSFDKQMKFISENYAVISMKDLIDGWKNGGLDQDRQYCIVTFDDGWLDNYENAYPIMKKYDIPATIFLATSFIGTNRWFWPDKISYLFQISNKKELFRLVKESYTNISDLNEVLKNFISTLEENIKFDDLTLIDRLIEGMKRHEESEIHNTLDRILGLLGKKFESHRITMNWDELKEMSQGGVTFGSHTCNHKLLTQLPPGSVEREVKESIAAIKEKGIENVPVFCYPNGYFNDEVADIVKKSGCETAVTTKYGFENAMGPDSFNMKRIGIHNDISSTVSLFSFHLSGLLPSVKSYA